MDLATISASDLLNVFFVLVGVALALALVLLVWVLWRVRRIHLPPGADLLTALRATPFAVVLLLDLLDFSLDFLSAPIAWALLGRLGLAPLRGVTVIEELIPGTQLIPTMTVAWVLARVLPRNRAFDYVSRRQVVDADGWRVIEPDERRIVSGDQRRRR